jgi:hypothetical protein
MEFYKRFSILLLFVVGGLYAEMILASKENNPIGQHWYIKFMSAPRYHWISAYILENTSIRFSQEIYKKDNLAQAIDRVMVEGIEQGELDSLSWLVLGTHFTAKRDEEFSFLANHMAHLADHKSIGGNSLQPVDNELADRIYRSNN